MCAIIQAGGRGMYMYRRTGTLQSGTGPTVESVLEDTGNRRSDLTRPQPSGWMYFAERDDITAALSGLSANAQLHTFTHIHIRTQIHIYIHTKSEATVHSFSHFSFPSSLPWSFLDMSIA